jgi:hypothetical protein
MKTRIFPLGRWGVLLSAGFGTRDRVPLTFNFLKEVKKGFSLRFWLVS